MARTMIALLTLTILCVGMGATAARAEISQRDQEEAALRAFEAARDELEGVARDAQPVVDGLTGVRDGAIEFEKDLIETLIEE